MKSTCDEVRDRNATAAKLSMALKERVQFLEQEAKSRRPSIERIRNECAVLREEIDRELLKYDRRHGTSSEWVATESRLRQFIGKQGADNDQLTNDIRILLLELARREAIIRGSQRIVGELVALCQRHGIAIPASLMGSLQ